MYEPVDLIEQSSTNAATGSTKQGEAICTALPHLRVYIIHLVTSRIYWLGFRPIQSGIIIGLRGSPPKEYFATNFQGDALLLLAPSDRFFTTSWEENFAFNDYSNFLFIMS